MKRKYDSIIIEHPTRGTLRDWDVDYNGEMKFRFSISSLRSDSTGAYQFDTVRSAALVWAMMPIRLRDQSHIMARSHIEYEQIV